MKCINTSVGVNSFVLRQIPGSGKTYSKILTFADIASIAEDQLRNGNYIKGYRDGVLLARAGKNNINKFICPFTKITSNTQLRAKLVQRREDEEPYIQIRALNGKHLITRSVDLILYRRDVLSETNEQTTNADWELISFNAIPSGIKSMPMGPVTMMRNQLQLKGGTKAHFNSEAWARSVYFWQKYAVLQE